MREKRNLAAFSDKSTYLESIVRARHEILLRCARRRRKSAATLCVRVDWLLPAGESCDRRGLAVISRLVCVAAPNHAGSLSTIYSFSEGNCFRAAAHCLLQSSHSSLLLRRTARSRHPSTRVWSKREKTSPIFHCGANSRPFVVELFGVQIFLRTEVPILRAAESFA